MRWLVSDAELTKIERVYHIDLMDKEGVVHASCEKLLCILSLRHNFKHTHLSK